MAARLGCCIVVTLISLLLCVVQVNGYLQPYLVNTTSTLPANMNTFNPSWRSVGWETRNYGEPTPIYVGYDGNSDLYIGWSDASNGHVSKFINDAYSSDVSISSSEIRGLVVHSDGSFAVLLWATPSLSIAKYDSNGNQAWKTTLETDRAEDFGLGDSRLTYGYLASKDGNRYAAYYKVHGTANSCGSPGTDGHEGDSLSYIDDSGTKEQIWCWGAGIGGCSHQMAGLISYNSVFNRTLPLCVTDCFPGSSDTSNGIGGVYADGVKIHDAIGNCGGTYGGELGGVEITPSGWIVTFNVPNANIGKNQNSLNGKNYDLGSTTVTIDASGNVVVGGLNWLTDTSENEIWSSIANYGSNQYLVGYVREETINNQVERKYLITLVDGSGKLLGGSEDITTVAGWGERNGFLAMPNGDVVWVYPYTYAAGAAGAYSTTSNQITVFRVKAGGSAAPFPSAASQISPFWFNLFF